MLLFVTFEGEIRKNGFVAKSRNYFAKKEPGNCHGLLLLFSWLYIYFNKITNEKYMYESLFSIKILLYFITYCQKLDIAILQCFSLETKIYTDLCTFLSITDVIIMMTVHWKYQISQGNNAMQNMNQEPLVESEREREYQIQGTH